MALRGVSWLRTGRRVGLTTTGFAGGRRTGPPPPVAPAPPGSPGAGRRWALAPAVAVSVLALALVAAGVPSGAGAISGAPAPVAMLAALGLLAALVPTVVAGARWPRRPSAPAAPEAGQRTTAQPRPAEAVNGADRRAAGRPLATTPAEATLEGGRRVAGRLLATTPAEAAVPFAFAVVLGWGTGAGVLITAAVTCAVALASRGRLRRAGLVDAARMVAAAAAGGAVWSALGGRGGAAPATADLPALATALVTAVLVGAGLARLGADGAVIAGPQPARPHRAARSGTRSAPARPGRRGGANAWTAVTLVSLAPLAWVVAARDPALAPLLLLPSAATSLVAGAVDASRRLDEEVERERARALGSAEAILATVSHELRAPLAVVLGSLETLAGRDGELTPEERRELIDMAARQSQRLKRLAAQLLLATRLEQAEVEDDAETVADAIRVVGEAERAMELLHPGRQVRLDAATRPLPVRAAPETVLQVLTNLLDNAAKYSPPDAPIGVTARQAGSSAVITVSDSGPGVPPEQRERIFERFTQLGSDQDNRGDGVGLGLFIARELARSVGGDLTVCPDSSGHSVEARAAGDARPAGRAGAAGAACGTCRGTAHGACFEVRLPLAPDGGARVVPPGERGELPQPDPPAAPGGSLRRH
jgi:signal transduction histidine kinase